jgi:co-chaperonin GroES (HSP10)
MKALGQTVVIKMQKEEVKNKSGLILTDHTTAKIRYKKGEVVTCGSEVEDLSPGDMVHYDHAAASDFMHEGETFWIVDNKRLSCEIIRL